VLAKLLASPEYAAVIECEPMLSDEVVSDATPELRATVPSTVTPSLKVTLPVGEAPVTVAVNVTVCPNALGFCDDTNEVDVLSGTAWHVTVTVP
jgi:hypothetical protein